MQLGDETANLMRLDCVESVIPGQLADKFAENTQITPVVADRMRGLSPLLSEFVEVSTDKPVGEHAIAP